MIERNRTKWGITVIELQDENGNKFKVTRRQPEFYIAETKVSKTKKEAREQVREWLEQMA